MEWVQELDRMARDPAFTVAVERVDWEFRALFRDARGAYSALMMTPSFDAAVEWLQAQARRLYPSSNYVQTLDTRGILTL